MFSRCANVHTECFKLKRQLINWQAFSVFDCSEISSKYWSLRCRINVRISIFYDSLNHKTRTLSSISKTKISVSVSLQGAVWNSSLTVSVSLRCLCSFKCKWALFSWRLTSLNHWSDKYTKWLKKEGGENSTITTQDSVFLSCWSWCLPRLYPHWRPWSSPSRRHPPSGCSWRSRRFEAGSCRWQRRTTYLS